MKKIILLIILVSLAGCAAKKPVDNQQIKKNAYKSFDNLETK